MFSSLKSHNNDGRQPLTQASQTCEQRGTHLEGDVPTGFSGIWISAESRGSLKLPKTGPLAMIRQLSQELLTNPKEINRHLKALLECFGTWSVQWFCPTTLGDGNP